MKIVETVTCQNDGKVVFGNREVRLELDTDSGELALNTPAMFVDPIVDFDELKEKLDRLAELRHHQ